MSRWSSVISRKYSIQEQDANTRAMQAQTNRMAAEAQTAGLPALNRANANLANARATWLPQDIASQIAERTQRIGREQWYDVAAPGIIEDNRANAALQRGAAQENIYTAQFNRRPMGPGDILAAALAGGQTLTEDQAARIAGMPTPSAMPTSAPVASPSGPQVIQMPRITGTGVTTTRAGAPPSSAGGFGAGAPVGTGQSMRAADPWENVGPAGRERMRYGSPPGYAKGTARVPGKGSGKVDTVKAKLAPGEAVLNRAAADSMGRGLIAALNKHGAQKMGLV